MFITRPEYSVWLPRLAGYEDACGWAVVELSATLPLYFLEVHRHGPRGATHGRQTFLLSSMCSLADALATFPAEGTKSRSVPARVTAHYPPGWVNASDNWRSLEIVEIWDAQVQRDTSSYDLWYLRARTGEELIEPSGIEDPASVRRHRRIFQAAEQVR